MSQYLTVYNVMSVSPSIQLVSASVNAVVAKPTWELPVSKTL